MTGLYKAWLRHSSLTCPAACEMVHVRSSPLILTRWGGYKHASTRQARIPCREWT
jgi:NADH:ubiquinone oxidoreductase subunit B-like Fe-S oxidoreductase